MLQLWGGLAPLRSPLAAWRETVAAAAGAATALLQTRQLPWAISRRGCMLKAVMAAAKPLLLPAPGEF